MTTRLHYPRYVAFPWRSRWKSYAARGEMILHFPSSESGTGRGILVRCAAYGEMSSRNIARSYGPTIEVSLLCYRGAVPIKADMAETLRVVLERSRNHPLNVQFGFVGLDDVEGRGVAGMERCFDIMIAHSKRWRVVDMMIPPYLLSRLSLIRGRIDWLENIRLSSYGDPQSGDIRAFEVAPKLKKLHLNDMHPEASIRFPVANLVSFFDKRAFGGDKLTREYLDVVRLAPNLRSFSYNDYGISHISMPLSFPCVTSRSLTELSASSPKFLRNMELPSLREFTLTTMCNADTGGVVIKCPEDALGALHEMLLRSQCSLTKLHLIDAVLDNNLANIIRLVPSLQEFDIDFYEWMDDYDPIMQSLVTQMSEVRLVDGSPQHSMVPSLQGLCVNLFDVSNRHISFINSAFVDMVASRLHQPTDTPRLRWLDLRALGHRQSYDIDESGENILESLMDDGLELYLSLHDNDRRFG
ncbi:uncharacterized protein EV420DRAFT_861504 [Desarmillaria tabescens]|uniref:F-box domain-containing protein n=1 Tax=Armillaria tabescens TaxID=1929756 RepID=A0AA39JSQ5_ARMTA|nr:uncharacterized protein EV420DRAFT_861504 [Desarmillaria tabescens]KAK0447822.1 hypothetical protein EV420DRAFT_861504 [Desarmillaria tabescens]